MINLQNLISIDRKEYYNNQNKQGVEGFYKKNMIYSLKKTLTDYEIGEKLHHKYVKLRF